MKWDAPQFSTLANVQGRCQMASSSRASQAWKVQLPWGHCWPVGVWCFFFAKRKRKNQHSHTQSTLHGTTSTAESCGAGVFGAETSRVKFRSCWRKEIAVSQMHEFRANGTRGGLQKGSRKGCLKEWTLLPTCCSSLQVCWHHIAYVLDFALQKCMRFGRCWKVRALGFTLQDVCVRVGCKALWSPYVCRGQFWGCC